MTTIFEINKNRLDEEWVSFVKVYGEYAGKLADARKSLEEAKAERELVVAELDRRIRLHPDKFGLEKITEPALEKTITLLTSYRNAHTAVINAKHEQDTLQAMMDTLDVKKTGLENIVKLRLADYFAEPRANGEDVRQFSTTAEKHATAQRTKPRRRNREE